MLLKNFYYALMNKMSNHNNTVKRIMKTVSGGTINKASLYEKDNHYFYYIPLVMKTVLTSIPNLGSSAYGGVMFGDGNTQPTADDYKLSGNIISTISYSQTVTTTENDDGSLTVKGVYTITNTGTEEIAIREVGIVSRWYWYPNTPTYSPVMIERSLLENEVVLQPSEVGVVEYTITVTSPV